MVSVIIPARNDQELVREVIDNLCSGLDENLFEIIVVDDGSLQTNGRLLNINEDYFQHSNIRVINNRSSFGVGYSFDRGVEQAKYDKLLLMGADVFPKKEIWLSQVTENIRDNEIGCAVCVGLTPGARDIDNPDAHKRHGAKLLYTVSVDDLPKNSALRTRIGGYTALFEAKWQAKLSDQPYEISCILGAFYFTTRSYYNKIHGWDTEAGKRFLGHQGWGSLEPYISLKPKVYGGNLRLYPDIKAGHIFGRIGRKEMSKKRTVRADLHWFNRLFIAHTMFEEDYARELLSFPKRELNLNLAEKYIKDNWENVLKVKERNVREGKLIEKII